MRRLAVPDPSLVLLVGASGSGKTTFARARFAPHEIVSSDSCRAMVCGDAVSQDATRDAFDVLHLVVSRRLARNLLTVVDATNVEDHVREGLLALARRHHVQPIAIVLDVQEDACLRHDAARPERRVPEDVVRKQLADLRRSLPSLADEGFGRVHVLSSPEEAGDAVIEREPLSCDRREDRGPFDVIGDVHGCLEELLALLARLGWRGLEPGRAPSHPDGRKLILLGDVVDRGPGIAGALDVAMSLQDEGRGTWLMGNHEAKLLRVLRGREAKITHGLEQTLAAIAARGPAFAAEIERRVSLLDEHHVLDGGRLVVAHAGMKQRLQGRWGKAVRAFGLYGESTGETDEYGLPVRYPWAKDYQGDAVVAYGHTPVPDVEWINGTLCLDTGCVFGGRLSALRWPEREIVQVAARRVWYEPARPFPRPETDNIN